MSEVEAGSSGTDAAPGASPTDAAPGASGAGTGGPLPLEGLCVVEVGADVPGAYATALLREAGAEVASLAPVGLEPADGPVRGAAGRGGRRREPLRPEEVPQAVEALRRAHLHRGKRLAAPLDASPAVLDRALHALVPVADVVVAELPAAASVVERVERLCAGDGRPSVLVVVSPFGRSGPWAGRPATEFILQAHCGSTGFRGLPEGPPLAVGGAVGDFLAGAWAAAAALCAWRRARRDGCFELVDLSRLEVMTLTMQAYEWLHVSLMGLSTVGRSVEVPSVERAKDGFVGLTIMTPAQWQALCEMIGRPELADDPELSHTLGRFARRRDVEAALEPYLRERTVDEVIEAAARHRVPATRLGTGATVASFDHLVERRVFVPTPEGGRAPRPPWRASAYAPRPYPPLGSEPEDPDALAANWRARGLRRGVTSPPGAASTGPVAAARNDPAGPALPLAGLRVVDLTSFLAGPALTALLAAMGADVVKVESTTRPDGLRLVVGPRTAEPGGLELSWAYQGGNVNKRAVTLDLQRDEGRALGWRLLEGADVLVENFSPRVLERLGFSWEALHAANPRLVVLRMPAFGLTGPWRDRTGFAQTMEMVSGMATVTGLADGPPVLPRGPCDPAAAVHGAVALLAALSFRDRHGRGLLLEVPMIEVALNLTAEQLFAADELGVVLERQGNRGPGAPQNLYRCKGDDAWLALSVVTNGQWAALRRVLGEPSWAADPSLDDPLERRRRHDELDRRLAQHFVAWDQHEAAEALAAAGVPAAAVVAPPDVVRNPQLVARGFFERLEHPVTGPNLYAGLPLRLSRGPLRWCRTPPPTLGQHNDEVLGGELGVPAEQLSALREAGVIGEGLRS